jgi:hypothetical protein
MQEGALARAHVCHKLTATGSKRRSSLNLNRNSALNLSAKGEALLGVRRLFNRFTVPWELCLLVVDLRRFGGVTH